MKVNTTLKFFFSIINEGTFEPAAVIEVKKLACKILKNLLSVNFRFFSVKKKLVFHWKFIFVCEFFLM
jgi:hypothetical protein